MNSARAAVRRAEWQPTLFNVPNRAELASCVSDWNCQTVRVRVHRNHGIEAVASGTPAYAGWNGLAFEWLIGGYDDSLSFDPTESADVQLVWLDTSRLRRFTQNGLASWLTARLQALRSLTTNPIVTLAWPLSAKNRNLLENAKIPSHHVVDLDPLAASLGEHWLDARAQSISGTRFSNQSCLRIARELACCWLPATVLAPRKAIAVDLDGTLYRGTLSEDGPSGIEVTDSHRAFQMRLAELRDAGILLALVSRNEPEDVENLFLQRTDFPLRLSDFSAMEVSWNDKANALRRIAATLRIGADAMVFVDDNPGELASAATSLPVVTVHARHDARETQSALEHVAGIFRWRTSAEDLLRNEDLRASQERGALEALSGSPDDYLRSLAVTLKFFTGPRQHLARMAELSAKTNQFNLSLGRMNEAEIARRLEQRGSNVIAIELADRLSESGIIGLVIGAREGGTMRIDELCISCRALGRRLEDSMLTKAFLVMAGNRSPETVVFVLTKGPRNEPARQWLARYTGAALCDEASVLEVPFHAISSKAISSAISTEVVQ